MAEFIPIKDNTMRTVPELKGQTGTVLSMYECLDQKTGRKFLVGKIITGNRKGAFIYPSGDYLALKTCEAISRGLYDTKEEAEAALARKRGGKCQNP